MSNLDLSKINRDILEHWKTHKTFEKSLEQSKDKPRFVFYDGPPFCTGLPHYGHLLASTIKDIIPRYKTQTGFYVERVFGFDTHGLPIEYEIEKDLGIKTKQQILDYGIANYNAKCRGIVMKYEKEWKTTIETLGRWVDYDNNWKTMDRDYMESVWWVFAQLYKQGRIYQGFKVMPYSTGCHTPLSNFEAQSNYKNVSDYSLTVKFRLTPESQAKLLPSATGETQVSVLVWTTTPWTLPSNLAICINPKFTYTVVAQNDEMNHYLIVAKDCLSRYFPDPNQFQIKAEIDASQLTGLRYQPLFPYYQQEYPQAFVIVTDSYVTDDKGTGCVHQAPAFGQEDYQVCLRYGLIQKEKEPPCPVDDDGCFTEVVTNYKSIYIKTAEAIIIKDLQQRGAVHHYCKEVHSVGHCWRSDVPLIYKAVPSWFMRVEDLSPELVKVNQEINWSPEFVGQNRFGNWLESTQDWCLSRNRYWGTPLPIWSNGEETVVIASVAELEAKTGQPAGSITDLHIDHIQHLTIPSSQGNKDLTIDKATMDCWFESGCMPYAHQHYPFRQNGDDAKMPPNFPADFIAEGLDQTRGWFYTLHVISTALYQKPAFKNVIVNGLILAEDSKKMSKKLKNYAPPDLILQKYGADVLRLYLINSDVVQAEPMRFVEKDLATLIQVFFLPYHNSVNFLCEMMKYHSGRFNLTTDFSQFQLDTIDIMMLQSIDEIIKCIHTEMEAYRLNHIVRLLTDYVDQVSRMYIKLKKPSIKDIHSASTQVEINILYLALKTLTLMLAPFAPFLAEHYYLHFFRDGFLRTLEGGFLRISERGLTNCAESVHFQQLPRKLGDLINITESQLTTDHFSTILMKLLDLGHLMRDQLPFSYKRPLKALKIFCPNSELMSGLTECLATEFNVLDLTWGRDDAKYVTYSVNVDFKQLASKGQAHLAKALGAKLKTEQSQLLAALQQFGYVEVNDEQVNGDLFILQKIPLPSQVKNVFTAHNLTLVADLEESPEIDYLYQLRQLTRTLNDYRKICGLTITDSSVPAQYQIVKTSNQLAHNWSRLLKDLSLATKLIFSVSEKNLDPEHSRLCEAYDAQFRVQILLT